MIFLFLENVDNKISYNGMSYYIEQTKLSYQDALEECKKKFGTLFEPRDLSTNMYVTNAAIEHLNMYSPMPFRPHFWIGIRDNMTDEFIYESGGWLNFTNMKGDEYSWGSGYCVLLSGDLSFLGKWIDVSCTTLSYSICEKKGKCLFSM